MSKQTRQFFEQLKGGGQVSLVDALKEAASPLRDIGGQLWDGMKPMFDHGRSELAAALFTGQAHVMYMKGEAGQAGVEQGQEQQQGQDQDQSKESAERQRDLGREM